MVVLGTVAGTGVATASNARLSATTKASGKITACIAKASGSTRVVTQTSTCRTGERAVRWMKGMRFRGVWSAPTTYRAGDVVFVDGASYVASRATTGAVPGVATRTRPAAGGEPGAGCTALICASSTLAA